VATRELVVPKSMPTILLTPHAAMEAAPGATCHFVRATSYMSSQGQALLKTITETC